MFRIPSPHPFHIILVKPQTCFPHAFLNELVCPQLCSGRSTNLSPRRITHHYASCLVEIEADPSTTRYLGLLLNQS
jgi:hypothetical protein